MRDLAIACASALGFLGLATTTLADTADRKEALIFGNSAYEMARLDTVAQDVGALADMLKIRYGYNVVTERDASAAAMRARIDELRTRSKGARSVLIYYAGYAFNRGDQNFLLGTDARFGTGVDSAAIGLTELTGAIDADVPQGVVLLDASYRNPALEAMRDAQFKSGLTRVSNARDGVAIILAQVPGRSIAKRNVRSGGGLADALRKSLDVDRSQPQSVAAFFNALRASIYDASQSDQEPWIAATRATRNVQLAALTVPRTSSVGDIIVTPAIAGLTPTVPVGVPPDESPDRAATRRALLNGTPESTEEDRRKVQAWLRDRKCYVGEPDGRWGQKSKDALERALDEAHEKIAKDKPDKVAELSTTLKDMMTDVEPTSLTVATLGDFDKFLEGLFRTKFNCIGEPGSSNSAKPAPNRAPSASNANRPEPAPQPRRVLSRPPPPDPTPAPVVRQQRAAPQPAQVATPPRSTPAPAVARSNGGGGGGGGGGGSSGGGSRGGGTPSFMPPG